MKHNFKARAQAAYAQAKAAKDPRDKAAFKAAAQTWERLARGAQRGGYSLEPHRLQIAALKRDVAEAIDAPANPVAVKEAVEAAAYGMAHARRDAVTIDF